MLDDYCVTGNNIEALRCNARRYIPCNGYDYSNMYYACAGVCGCACDVSVGGTL